ncbi:hypothetical protein CU041_07830 [Thalassospira povalilytica]|uniref:Uncharacterized protein n=1 Tax=Thalassospira povalilytica TaxID=732237 RepID=A0ABX4RB82_9PROT|nr:hypothetical protein CU041_07830 [Thalassospira povalilytica]
MPRRGKTPAITGNISLILTEMTSVFAKLMTDLTSDKQDRPFCRQTTDQSKPPNVVKQVSFVPDHIVNHINMLEFSVTCDGPEHL